MSSQRVRGLQQAIREAGFAWSRQERKRLDPMVTLFYDTIKKLTVAVLSQHVDPALTMYLEARLRDGSAYRVSSLYVELEGYIRENRCHILQHLSETERDYDDETAVTVAIGSLEQSDDAHRQEMEAERQVHCDSQQPVDESTLEKVLEVACLHRLNEDLDVMSWRCEEIALANLHRWWGDISLPDYEGQKLLLSWVVEPSSVDGMDHFSENRSALISSLKIPAETRLCPGERVVAVPSVGNRLRVLESTRLQRDDVSTLYSGRMEVVSVHLDFLALVRASVRASARAMGPMLREKHRRIEELRPLMLDEVQYLEQIEFLARTTCKS
jgi:hypothetical protein